MFALSVIVTLFAVGCQKTSNSPTIQESKNEDENRRNIMMNAKMLSDYSITDMQEYSEEMQRQIFTEMSVEDRYRIWVERLEQYIGDETNGDLASRATDLKNKISLSLYDESTTDLSVVESWVENNMTAFGYEKMKGLTTTLARLSAGGTIGGGTPGPAASLNCSCSQRSDWCMNDDGTYVHCKGTSCDESSGCGTLWLFKCNGRCSRI